MKGLEEEIKFGDTLSKEACQEVEYQMPEVVEACKIAKEEGAKGVTLLLSAFGCSPEELNLIGLIAKYVETTGLDFYMFNNQDHSSGYLTKEQTVKVFSDKHHLKAKYIRELPDLK